jgi:hypothetical protein
MSYTVHQGDALAILPALDPGTIDLVLADPPYNSGGRTGAERGGQSARGKYVSGDAGHELADFPGDNRDQRSFTLWLSLILGGCLRLARPGASALVFCDWRQLPATSDALQAAGWTWRGIIPWRKPISRPDRQRVPPGMRVRAVGLPRPARSARRIGLSPRARRRIAAPRPRPRAHHPETGRGPSSADPGLPVWRRRARPVRRQRLDRRGRPPRGPRLHRNRAHRHYVAIARQRITEAAAQRPPRPAQPLQDGAT